MIKIPKILLPNENVDKSKWATVACDQYTSEPEYWKNVENAVKDSVSTYYLMLPELYLEDKDVEGRIRNINETMEKYVAESILEEHDESIIIVERSFDNSPTRTGMMIALDLEDYDFHKESKSLIRATEGTVEERIPPRMKIRKNALIEMPHILVLIDDPDKTVIEPVTDYAKSAHKPVYDFDLMAKGGHLKGYEVNDKDVIDTMQKNLIKLCNTEYFMNRYNVDENTPPMLFAVGDGNHSLASAKCHWDSIKGNLTEEERDLHPARYALCEIVNIHDAGIVFEPIHRVLFNIEPELFFDDLAGYFGEKASVVTLPADFDENELAAYKEAHSIIYITESEKGVIYIDKNVHTLSYGAIQPFLDQYICGHRESKIDYIHGLNSLTQLSKIKGNLGLVMPCVKKDDFFASIIKNGPMPRKTFSLGEANEKRYYMECRLIK